MSAPAMTTPQDRAFYLFTAVVSAVALGVIAWLLVLRTGGMENAPDLRFMPAVNAALNATSTVLLATAWWAIRGGRRTLHKFLTVSAFLTSGLFLAGYLAYHYVHGDTKFTGEGAIRVVYLVILATHVLLSMFVVPGALLAFWFAARGSFQRHTRVTRILMPVWLYVSVTGVLIWFMLRR